VLDSTYETFARKRSMIKRRIAELKSRKALDKYREWWHPLPNGPESGIVGAEDGSANHRKYKSLVFYVANAVALVFDEGVREFKYSDIDLLYPFRNVESRVSLYRSILEVKASLEALREADMDIFLIDGSIFSDLVALKMPVELKKEEREEVIEMLPELEEIGAPIASKKMAASIEGEKRLEKIMFLEYLEYLSALQMLIEEGRDKLVGISKTSSGAELREDIPDMAVYEEVTSTAGFSRLFVTPLNKRFPVYEEFFGSTASMFTKCYARLEDRKGVLMVEFPRQVKEEEVQRVLNIIRGTSVMGYPYPLRRAHRQVVVTDRDIRRFSRALGITEKTGREVLA
jgi:NurA-like 5'-3' nuclease